MSKDNKLYCEKCKSNYCVCSSDKLDLKHELRKLIKVDGKCVKENIYVNKQKLKEFKAKCVRVDRTFGEMWRLLNDLFLEIPDKELIKKNEKN